MTAGQPARAVLALGSETDALHCASVIVLGSLSCRWRAAAFADAVLAGSLACHLAPAWLAGDVNAASRD